MRGTLYKDAKVSPPGRDYFYASMRFLKKIRLCCNDSPGQAHS